ncbi:extracellular ribonuclease LE-like [Senna tora]|uniref:Extracellular ribonuclease LE-like n=1 Tax=Senna tora TaxID=362788 RepID=A0A834SWE9_9FABA|nr:extracellular ribonuclease LE-like [Senna tora]
MKSSLSLSMFIKLFLLLALLDICVSKSVFDFFYFVQQWPGSYCDTKRSCCYPITGKPASNFSIHGLWPNYNNGSWPSDCNPKHPFNQSQISDLVSRAQTSWPSLGCPSSNNIKFWKHEWSKHGTCSESVGLDQHAYFQHTLDLKDQIDLLQILQDAGIKPDGSFYNVSSIEEAIEKGSGYFPGIRCNFDASRNSQLLEIYLCVDKSATRFIDCPILPHSNCPSQVEFPTFGADSGILQLATPSSPNYI